MRLLLLPTIDPVCLVVPVVGFGCGLTNIKLRNYAVHAINQFAKKLLKGGTTTPSETKQERLKEMTLEQLSARLFKNNDVINNLAAGGNDDTTEQEEALSSMKGEEFVPNHERRQIHEEEYNEALNPGLKLRFRIGVCGYRHPLPASGNKQMQAGQQMLKRRQIYAQRETAAATIGTDYCNLCFREKQFYLSQIRWDPTRCLQHPAF